MPVRGVRAVEFVMTPVSATQETFPDSKPGFSNNCEPGAGVGVGLGLGVGVGVGVGPVSSEYSSRLGDPDPGLVTLFSVELLMIAEVTVAGEAVVFVSRKSAATPATCGAAIEVPEIVLVAVSLVLQEEVMLEPGAKMSRQVPKLENEERASALVVAPTVIALATRAGDVVQASALLLPAAIA